MMNVVDSINALRSERRALSGRVAFVPTMGNLHAGHLSLVELAAQQADHVVVSIFVNPLQFSPGEDLDRYPRTLARDLAMLSAYPVSIVYTPDEAQLYPNGREAHTQVVVPWLSTQLCGRTRPNFFGGIATVVTKLFQLVQPDVAVFGQKDYQQGLVVKRLIEDLCFDIELVMAPIVREQDGLAMSSRNQYLTASERALAPSLYAMLQAIQRELQEGLYRETLLQDYRQALPDAFVVDYLELRSAETLQTLESPGQGDQVLLAAMTLGSTRLIDNVVVTA